RGWPSPLRPGAPRASPPRRFRHGAAARPAVPALSAGPAGRLDHAAMAVTAAVAALTASPRSATAARLTATDAGSRGAARKPPASRHWESGPTTPLAPPRADIRAPTLRRAGSYQDQTRSAASSG